MTPKDIALFAATVAVDGGAGVLHIVKNYTGDVMNFEMAAEMMSGPVERVLVNDDVAVEDALAAQPALRARLAGTEGAIVAQRRSAVRTYREKAPRTDTWCFVQPCDASPYLGTGDACGSGAQKILRDDTRDPFLTASPVPSFEHLAAPGLRTIGIDADSQDQAVVDAAPDAALDTPILWSTE